MKILPPVLVLILLGGMVLAHYLAPMTRLIASPLSYAGLIPLIGGLWISIAAARQFQRVKTNLPTFNDPNTLVTEGLFRISRNPMYLGFVLFLLGAAWLTGSWVALALVAIFAVVADRIYIPFEERAMWRVFGKAYEAYALRTRRWL